LPTAFRSWSKAWIGAGDNVCFDSNEYPSIVAPLALRPRAELRFARGIEPNRLAALVDTRTRLIGVSYVSYPTGERFDLAALRRLADSVGALHERGVWAWNGRGRIRFSFHGYNGGDDVDRIVAALRAAWPG